MPDEGQIGTPAMRRGLALLAAIAFAVLFLALTVPRVVVDPFQRSTVARLADGGLRIDSRSLIASAIGPADFRSEAFRSGPFTLEFDVTPSAATAHTIATLFSYSTSTTFNWSIEQHGRDLMVLFHDRGLRFRNIVTPDRRQHFLVGFSAEGCSIAKDGILLGAAPWPEPERRWNDAGRFTVANLDWGDYPWQGSVHRFRIFAGPLPAEEAVALSGGAADPPGGSPPMLRLDAAGNGVLSLAGNDGRSIGLTTYAWPWTLKLADLVNPFRQIVTVRDVVLNVLLTVGLGLSVAAWLRLGRRRRAILPATAAVFLLSLSVEAAQLFSPVRTASLIDVTTNTLGAWLGACLWTAAVSVLRRLRPER